MHSDKKLTKEDTWRPADLRKHIREEGRGDEYIRRREDPERKRRGGESTERRHREPEKESRGERDHRRERERYTERHKEGSRDRREEREKRREKDALTDYRDKRRDRDRDRDREEKHGREKDRERHREREEREGQHHEEREKRRAERERRRHGGERGVTETSREQEKKKHHEDRREKHRKHPESREPGEEQRRHREERERRHGERGRQDETRKYDGESRERGGPRGEEVRRHGGDRERAERDRERERRRQRERAEEEEGRSQHKDRSEKRERTEDEAAVHAGDAEEPVVHAEDPAEQEYEDDFEDYEEDFEDMEESADEDEKEPRHAGGGEEGEELTAQRRREMEAIQRAMDEENERAGTVQSRGRWSRDEEPSRSTGPEESKESQRGKFIDFVAAKQREVSRKVSTKQKKRSTELLRLIELDSSQTFSLLDLPPLNEYHMYIRHFGAANTKQAYAQCNEDNADRDVQTEETDVCDKWTQHPPEDRAACGDPNVSQEAQEKSSSELKYDSQRLAAFLRSASQVLLVLLEEDHAEKKSQRTPEPPGDTPSFSDGASRLNTKLPFLHGRHIRLLHFSQVQRHTMMSVHDPPAEPSPGRHDGSSIVCVWNIREPSRPQQVLVYESQILCCCFSPGKASLVFAGTCVGSVLLWDLREHATIHHCRTRGDWTFRQPTFSTDSVLSGSGHLSAVTSVEVVPSAAGGWRPDVPLLASEEESAGSSFQLASLDESGLLNFWVAVELPKADEAGSPTDLGLRPGGRVKLLHSSSLLAAERVSPQEALNTAPVQTRLLKFLPTDSNHFFIGTNVGRVAHGTSHGLKAPPKFYRCREAGVRPVDVTSISFSPFVSHLFLVGCSDGSIRLHAVSHEQPVAQWTSGPAGEPVVWLQWSRSRPAVFCVLDAASQLHVWDLMSSDSAPVLTEQIHADRVTAAAMFGDSGRHNTYSGIGLAHESGKIEMLYLSRKLTVPLMAEEEKLESLMGDAF